MGSKRVGFARRLWRRLARRLPPDVRDVLVGSIWSVRLAVYRVSGRRWGRSPELWRAGVPRQVWERRRIPGMTTVTERAYFCWHAQEEFAGMGAIIDLGSWLGSTTASMAMGLAANPRPAARRAVIHAYDRFLWDEALAHHSAATRFGPYRPGDSFRPEFERVVRPWRERIVIHEADLLEESWSDGPVELLLVDAMKSWDLASQILRGFYPALLPTNGCLIHQDFSHWFTPWVPVTTYRLLDHLQPVIDVPRSESMAFRVRRQFTPSALELSRSSFDEDEIEQAFRHWLSTTLPEKHSGLRAAQVLLAYYDGDEQRARRMRASMAERGQLSEDHLTRLGYVLGPMR